MSRETEVLGIKTGVEDRESLEYIEMMLAELIEQTPGATLPDRQEARRRARDKRGPPESGRTNNRP